MSLAVRQVLPAERDAGVHSLMAQLGAAATTTPFGPELVDFGAAFSRRLSREARGLPEAQALAFWMRRAEISRLAAEFAALGNDRVLLVPRGTVFHVPPGNVDTIFVYSWLLSTLVGNRNVVRLSSRNSEQTELIIGVLRSLLDDGAYPTVRAGTAMIRYGRDRAVTDALSAGCDLRVVWGGDGTVAEVRRSPLPPHATELTFPDRFSLAALAACGYLALPESGRDALLERFFTDAYWFDQLGCSSPRLVVWVGERGAVDRASPDFFARLAETTRRRGYRVDTATAVAKLGYGCRAAIEAPVAALHRYDNSVTVLPLTTFAAELRGDACGDFSGAGLFFQLRVDSLLDLVPHIERRDQTLAQFGFAVGELTDLVRALNGRGIDRIVPFGRALTFDRVWDGHDLLQSFTRRSTVDASEVPLT